MIISTINPATGEKLGDYQVPSPGELEAMIEKAGRAATGWAATGVEGRARLVAALAGKLRERTEDLASLITREMGKPLAQSRSEVEKCAWVCDYYAENGPSFLADEKVPTEMDLSEVYFEPLGVVLAVMPWNFPFWQVFRFAAPALVAGNGALLKHASSVSGCALAIQDLVLETGFPEGVLQSLIIPSDQVESVIRHPVVRAVTLTGSEPAGRAVAACAAQSLKKSVVELGGSDPYIVLEDADLELATGKCAASRLNNAGQTCIAAKRFMVVEAVLGLFEDLLLREMKQYRLGDPMKEDTDLGPLAREDLREELHRQVQDSLQAGARLLMGGQLPPSGQPGFYYPATVLTGVRPEMPVFREETFGPVAAIVPVRDEAEAVRLANQSDFGLGAAVFTASPDRANRVARQLQAGCVFINDFVRSDPRLPFGGLKNSGFGRELSRYGILEFLNIKSVAGRIS